MTYTGYPMHAIGAVGLAILGIVTLFVAPLAGIWLLLGAAGCAARCSSRTEADLHAWLLALALVAAAFGAADVSPP